MSGLSAEYDVNATDRGKRKQLITDRRVELGLGDSLPVTVAASSGWTCAGLQAAADLMDVQAVATSDPDEFFYYASAAAMFQDAHDAQCP